MILAYGHFWLSFGDSLFNQIMWAEALGKLEGMESSNRERLWPQLVQGFKDLSNRLKVLAALERKAYVLILNVITVP